MKRISPGCNRGLKVSGRAWCCVRFDSRGRIGVQFPAAPHTAETYG